MGSVESNNEVVVANNFSRTKKTPDCKNHLVPKYKLPHEVIDGFTN